MLFKDLYATRRLKGLGLGQGGLILCGDARIAYQGHEYGPFAILCIANKRPFVNKCKRVLSRRAGAESLGFLILNAIREVPPAVARAYYVKSMGNGHKIAWVMCILCVFCTYEAASTYFK